MDWLLLTKGELTEENGYLGFLTFSSSHDKKARVLEVVL